MEVKELSFSQIEEFTTLAMEMRDKLRHNGRYEVASKILEVAQEGFSYELLLCFIGVLEEEEEREVGRSLFQGGYNVWQS